jgi:hypothetical protein
MANTTTTAEWIEQGDRSHSNLFELDSLSLSYPGWEDDVKEAEEAHIRGEDIRKRLNRLAEAQRLNRGDRSHWRLVKLDSMDLSYPGWESDLRRAEEFHVTEGETWIADEFFKNMVSGARNKQQLFQGDRSHPNLQKLDYLQLDYPGWEEDVIMAEQAHQRGGSGFDQELFVLEERQRVHYGDRSHSRLVELDSFKFSYPEWEEDFKKAEGYHVGQDDVVFQTYLEGMQNKQQMLAAGDRSHPNLVRLDGLSISYPNHKQDIAAAEEAHLQGYGFEDKCRVIKERQRVFLGDRSHPRLVKLDLLSCSYPGWEADVERAEQLHLTAEITCFKKARFNKMMEGIRNKQQLYDGYELENSSEGATSSPKSPAHGTCIACMTKPSTHAFVPCGHFCMCDGCSSKSMDIGAHCPMCRESVQLVMKVFFT